jgi:hypothetical protein
MREFLPPTEMQQDVAAQINEKLPLGMHVSFCRVVEEVGADPVYRMFWSYGPRRKVVSSDDEFFDVEGIVKSVLAWRGETEQVRERYTTEMPEDFQL